MSGLATAGFSYCPVLGQMIETQQWIDDDGAVHPAFGLSTTQNLTILRNLMLAFNPERTLEVGLSMGASALVFTQSHKDLGHPPAHQHVAMDPWQKAKLSSIGLKALDRAGLSGYVEFSEQTSDLALPKLWDSGRMFDMIYVDGSHWFEDVFLDCHYSYHLLSPGGILLFDDSADPNIAKVLKFIRRNMHYGLSEFELARYRSDAGRSLRYRVGRRVGRTQLTGFRKTGTGRRPLEYKTRAF